MRTALALLAGICILIVGCGESSTTANSRTNAQSATPKPSPTEQATSAGSQRQAQQGSGKESNAGVTGVSVSTASEKMIGDWVLDVSAMRQEGGFNIIHKAQRAAEDTFTAEWKNWHITTNTITTGPQTEKCHVRYEVVDSEDSAATLRVTDSQTKLFPPGCKVEAMLVAPGKLKLEPPRVLRLVNFLILQKL